MVLTYYRKPLGTLYEMKHGCQFSTDDTCEIEVANLSPTPGLALHTTVTGKCPISPEDEQEKQEESRDR
ncbi:hypothetical protein TNCV_1444541 [Trichonephila clavipes]|nr:hypothetical protein TNCV_1444541 [Trichonephila clavipes]